MPKCKKCGSNFPNRKKIDGKLRILSSRKYCLNCSPFNNNNRKRLEIPDCNLTCNKCNKTYDYRRGTNSHTKCSKCCYTNAQRRIERKNKCVEYKGGKCLLCNYHKCLDALCFHHLDSNIKEFKISGSQCLSWDKIRKELDKCVLLCCRCHTEVHAGITEVSSTV